MSKRAVSKRRLGRADYEEACALDRKGREREAAPRYELAIARGLTPGERRGALLGLGSTYRCLGSYGKAVAALRRGQRQFPQAREFDVFLAMALYHVGRHGEAMKLLLRVVADTSSDPGVRSYRRAITFYANQFWRRQKASRSRSVKK